LADDAVNSSPSPSLSSDEEDEARNEALGLGGAKLKAVLSDLNKKGGLDGDNAIPVKGGEVLSVIYDRMQKMSGDPAALTLYGEFLRSAGVPYVTMLQGWMSTGTLHDPWEELCVKESKSITRGTLDADYTDQYWDGRYTVSNVVTHSTLSLTKD
jgi:gamma-tubulin complex component 2